MNEVEIDVNVVVTAQLFPELFFSPEHVARLSFPASLAVGLFL